MFYEFFFIDNLGIWYGWEKFLFMIGIKFRRSIGMCIYCEDILVGKCIVEMFEKRC